MRSNKSLLLAGLAAFVAVTFLALGCSDDDNQPTPPVTPDNGIESLLSVVQAQVNQYLDSAVITMEAGLRVATFTDIGSANQIGDIFMGSSIPDSTSGSGSWIVSYLTDLGSGVGVKTILDSLTYVVDGHLSINARNAEAMYARHKYSFASDDTTVTYTNMVHNGDLHITGIDGSTATINGTFYVTLRDKNVSGSTTTWNYWTVETTVNDLTFVKAGHAWTSGCPNTGTFTSNVIRQYAVNDDIPTYTQWQFDGTVTDGQIDVDVATGNLTASYVDTLCTL